MPRMQYNTSFINIEVLEGSHNLKMSLTSNITNETMAIVILKYTLFPFFAERVESSNAHTAIKRPNSDITPGIMFGTTENIANIMANHPLIIRNPFSI